MKEISYCFAVVEPSDIKDILLKRQAIPSVVLGRRFMSNQKIVFSQDVDKGENGLSWSQRFRATCKDGVLMEFNGLKKSIAIFLADGKIILIGNAMSSPLLTVTEHEEIFEITADFSTPEQSTPIFVL